MNKWAVTDAQFQMSQSLMPNFKWANDSVTYAQFHMSKRFSHLRPVSNEQMVQSLMPDFKWDLSLISNEQMS